MIDYKRGGKSSSHRHNAAFKIAYVLSGAIRSKNYYGKKKVFHAGKSWPEKPGGYHASSVKPSDREYAKRLDTFIADNNQEKTLLRSTKNKVNHS